jgi:hypothetical protein
MKRRLTVFGLTSMVLSALTSVVLTSNSSVLAEGAVRIGGIGYFAGEGECEDPQGEGADFALLMTGDLVGCHYVFIQEWECSPSGTYRERGTEIFVGSYDTRYGTFETTYLFTAKLRSCPLLETEIWGRCQHPIARGSGMDGFEGVTGRFDIKDDIEAGNFPYKGHLRW